MMAQTTGICKEFIQTYGVNNFDTSLVAQLNSMQKHFSVAINLEWMRLSNKHQECLSL